MIMKGALVLYISLTLGYVLCVLAAKQKDILKTVGYTLGIAIIVLSLGQALVISYTGRPCVMHKHCMMMKHGPGCTCPCCKMMK